MTTTCIATIDDSGRLCGAPATTTRVVEELVCPLCQDHAGEIDAERAEQRAEEAAEYSAECDREHARRARGEEP